MHASDVEGLSTEVPAADALTGRIPTMIADLRDEDEDEDEPGPVDIVTG